jgi:cobalt-zinc-cadmium efflux system outer membrane protein
MKNRFDKYYYKLIISLFPVLLFLPTYSYPGLLPDNNDSVKINITQAEKIFLQNNLQLLAAKYNINAAKASVIQSELWDNPNITIGQNIYNKYTGKYFDFTKSGNTDLQIQQLIRLAGKRNNQVKIAEINTDIAEASFYDLLRTLKYELRTDLNDLFFLQKTLAFYDDVIPSVKKTVGASEKLFEGHSILLSEVLRLKSLLLTLESEKLNTVTQISGIENDLNILLADSTGRYSCFIPQLNVQSLDSLNVNNISLNEVIQTAYESRPDIKIAELNVKSEETNLALQKALAIPDITVGGSYSRNGSYIPDYIALTLSVDLPVFNRNQGNIQASENNIDADKTLLSQARLSVRKDVISAYDKAIETDKLYQNFDKKFTDEYAKLVSGMVSNYEGRNMTIIEFTDFYESYRSSVLQTLQLQNNRIDAFENLNFTAGRDLLFPAGY